MWAAGTRGTRGVPLVWASRKATGAAVHVSEVPSGLSCDCVCPGCQADLEAVNSRNPHWKHRPHFRHYKVPETEACSETAMLAVAMAVLAETGAFQLPDLIGRGSAKSSSGKTFEAAVREPGALQEVSAYEFIDATDAVLTLTNGERIYVRLTARPLPDAIAEQKQTQLAEVIIVLDDPVLKTADWETMRRHIRLLPRARGWCRNPRLVQLDARATEQAKGDAAGYEQGLSADREATLEKVQRIRRLVNERQAGPPASSRRQITKLDVWRTKYRDGADILSAPRIDFERILREAEQARTRGVQVQTLIPGWLSKYKLEARPEVLAALLSAGGFLA